MLGAIVGQSFATAAHPFNLEINGIDYIAQVQWPTTSIEMAGPGTNGSMVVELEDPTSSVNVNEWDEVRFIEHAATSRPILFGGFVQSVRYRIWAVGGRTLVITCVGYGILLDKKACIDQPAFNSLSSIGVFIGQAAAMGPLMTSYVSRYGGRISTVGVDDPGDTGTVGTDASHGVANLGIFNPAWVVYYSVTPPAISVPSTLRSAIESLSGLGIDADAATGLTFIPTPATYWVDSAAMLRCLPDMSSSSAGWATHQNQQYDDAVPGFALDTAGTYIVETLEYEREDTDRITSTYVSGTGAGTGFYRGAPLERAGDLEAVFVDSTSTSAFEIVARGSASVAKTSRSTGTGTATLGSTTPLSVWPGRQITVDNAQANLSGSQKWRITGVRIRFRSSTYRTYEVAFGGSVPQPSAMRRTGKYSTRSR